MLKQSQQEDQHRCYVLVVDDQEFLRELLTRVLEEMGHTVMSAEDGAGALVLLREHAFDLVLLDIMMPVITGIDVLVQIKHDPALRDIPVIVISANDEISDVVHCITLGAEDYLVKPYNSVLLRARINTALTKRRLWAEQQTYLAELEELVVERAALAEQRAIALDHSQLELRESEERYALAALGSNDGLWDWDLRTNQIVYSSRWKAMLGYDDNEIDASPDTWFGLVHLDDRERLEIHLEAHFKKLITHFEREFRMLHREGDYRWILCRGLAVWDTAGQVVRMAGSQTDITSRKAAEQRLVYDALHDTLTDLPNRALFTDRLERVIVRAKCDKLYRFAVMFLDLDRFKAINDSLGHVIGDKLLIATAQRITSCVSAVDTVARLGGDEFTILIEDIADEAFVIALAERIQQTIMLPLRIDQQEIFVSASIGITLGSLDYEQSADLIRDADTAMYHAKIRGKACQVIFDPTMHALAMARLQTEIDLRSAIARHELRLHYQPIISLVDRSVIGFEALLRWQHPHRGLLYPDEFIAIAEETGLIVPIGWWVLHEACQQTHSWMTQHESLLPLSISVNVSGKQLRQPDALEQIRHVLSATALDPGHLKLEITEHTFIEYGETTAELLANIRGLGIHLCIDDFGTGYSSLSYLHRLPVDVLKIDRSFINHMGPNGEQSEIVKTIVILAHALGIATVAEGTETIEQIHQLEQLQCDFGQGWFFAKALSSDQVHTFLQTALHA